jgi:stage V sporulation protein AE
MLDYLCVFLIGGAICAIGQILLDKTRLTPARILVLFVVSGVVLTAVGVYDDIVKVGKAGATVPIVGFGYALAEGVKKAVAEKGFIGAFTGGVTGTAAGITAAVFFGYIFALIAKPGDKS